MAAMLDCELLCIARCSGLVLPVAGDSHEIARLRRVAGALAIWPALGRLVQHAGVVEQLYGRD